MATEKIYLSIYIIVEANSYDGFEHPEDYYYPSESEAQKECDRLNKLNRGDYFQVHEMIPIAAKP